ncbi:MAG: Ig-like domain-containing protein [Nannocystaceae bacterium]|nr:Ig-like domain-containing protein [bacterium]
MTLDGEEDPNAITEHGRFTLAADVDDDGTITEVEFWSGNTLLETLTGAPYELSIAFSSVDSGLREFRAVATDDAGQVAEDSVEVSVNIAGGNLENIDHDLFDGVILPVSVADSIGGAITEINGRIYVSATQSSGDGILLATLPELETQWQREFDGPLWSLSSAIDDNHLAVAVSEAESWVAYVLDLPTGDTSTSWTLGPEPANGILGPHITSTSAGLLATTTATDVALFDTRGALLEDGFSVGSGVITELVTASDDSLVYVSFGDALNASSTTCATNSDFCAQAVEPGNGVLWVTGLSEQPAGIHRIAPTDDGGAFVAAALDSSEFGFELHKLTPQGVIVDTSLQGESGPDESGDRVRSLSPDNKGGVVACGGTGFLIDEDSSPSPFVAAFDPDLNLVWLLRDFVEAEDGAYAMACAVTDEAVYVYGLRDMVVEFLDEEPVAVGSAWLARISL